MGCWFTELLSTEKASARPVSERHNEVYQAELEKYTLRKKRVWATGENEAPGGGTIVQAVCGGDAGVINSGQ